MERIKFSLLAATSLVFVVACGSTYMLPDVSSSSSKILEYTLITMDGHQESLERDKKVLGVEALTETKLYISDFGNNQIEWNRLDIGGCVKYQNTPSGPWELLHRCTELVKIDGMEREYLPYALAGRNFVDIISPQISETKRDGSGKEILWINLDGKQIARFVGGKIVE